MTLDSWPCLRVHWLCLQEHEPHPHLDSNLQLCWWQSPLPIVVIIQTIRNREPLRQKRQDPVQALHQDAQHSNWRGTKPRQGDMVYCSNTLQARFIREEKFYAGMFRCEICGKFLTSETSNMLPCLPSSASIDNNGMVVPKHERWALFWCLFPFMQNRQAAFPGIPFSFHYYWQLLWWNFWYLHDLKFPQVYPWI